MDIRIQLNKTQQKTIDRAIKLLEPYAQNEQTKISYSTYYFKIKDEGVLDTDCCDDKKCIKKTLKNIREEYGKYTRVETICYTNDGDHDKIERCNICGRPLNEFLTWIDDEFKHHKENSITKKDLIDPATAFEVKSMLDAMPSCDYEISGYTKHQYSLGNLLPLMEEKRNQKKFVAAVVDYAKLIIKELK